MFVAIKSCVETHIGHIHREAFCSSCGEHVVPVELDSFNICSLSGDNAWMISDEVATDCDSGSFGFFLLRADGADNL